MRISDVAIIVVWYNPTEQQRRRFMAIGEDCSVIIVDNSEVHKNEELDSKNVYYYPQQKNVGIAAAQNIGISRAKENGYKFVVFFDQDSVPEIDSVITLKKEFQEIYESGKNIAALGPRLIDESTGKEYANYRGVITERYQEVEMIMSTSTFTSIQVLDEVGGMREEMFIDFVDHEWCWRARNKGYVIYQTESVSMCHKVGRKTVRILGYERVISSPTRYYYQFRNSLWLRHVEYAPSGWKKRVIPRLIVELLVVLFYNCKAFPYALRGWSDGVRKPAWKQDY